MSASRPFRVRVVSPIAVTEADLGRRQRRYGAHAGPDTQVTVDNLAVGPVALRAMEHLWTDDLWPR